MLILEQITQYSLYEEEKDEAEIGDFTPLQKGYVPLIQSSDNLQALASTSQKWLTQTVSGWIKIP